ncbi:hypothetical protein V6N12_005739 [Hibiscus sabdariffa]|uniref:Uncharacterized protein n=1 Tax=Hibiscus sabdariffa TaxID=183260 RepID=A0ABR2B970_9ROSI
MHDWRLWLHTMRLLALGDSSGGGLPILLELRSTSTGCFGRRSVLASTSLAWPACGLSIACYFGSSVSVLCNTELHCCMMHLTAWYRLPKRSASRPRDRVSLVEDDADASVPAPTAAPGSPSKGLPTEVASTDAPHPASDSVAASLAPADRLVSSAPTTLVQATAVTEDIPHDLMVQTDTSDMVEKAIEDASLDLENFETAADRLASEDVPYDPMADFHAVRFSTQSWAFSVFPGLSSPYSYAGGA